MKGGNMKNKITITVDKDLLEAIDELVITNKFTSRSHAFNYYVKQGLLRGV